MIQMIMHPLVVALAGVAASSMVFAWYFWSVGNDRKKILSRERAKFSEYKEDVNHKLSMRDDVIERLTLAKDKYEAQANSWKEKYEELEGTAYSVTDKLEANIEGFKEEITGLKYKNEVLQSLVSNVVMSYNIKRPKLASIINRLPERLHDAKKFEKILSFIMKEANKNERL